MNNKGAWGIKWSHLEMLNVRRLHRLAPPDCAIANRWVRIQDRTQPKVKTRWQGAQVSQLFLIFG